MRRIFAILAPLALAGCISAPPPPCAAPAPAFSPIRFFDGHTEGQGVIHAALRKDKTIRVHSHGVIEPGGTLRLDQVIEEEGKPAMRRLSRLREVSPGRLAGTASDALDGVTGEREGNRAHLAYRLKGGYPTDQWITLAPDGHSAESLVVLHKLGNTVAVIRETIRKVG